MKYKLIRSKRRKRSLSIRVNSDLEVIVRSPLRTRKRTIDKFVKKHSNWINKSIAKVKSSPYKKKLDDKDFKDKKEELSKYLNINLAKFSKKMSVNYKSYTIKNVTSYWGQCTSDNRLSFNANLADFDSDTIDYVIVHELAHTKMKGHNKKFWDIVATHAPDYKKHIKLLKGEGLRTD